ncbi:hypothetical protein NHG98_01850 [Wolbachia endosymbiont of Aedes albopictus]|nr:hypothetical protein NHG98_01850 [Wolbachia endosymbiont of Aedes albopictus]
MSSQCVTLGSSFFFSRFQTGMTPLLGSFSHVIPVRDTGISFYFMMMS